MGEFEGKKEAFGVWCGIWSVGQCRVLGFFAFESKLYQGLGFGGWR